MIFITGTDTNIGKTLISSWLCLHTRFNYFKPIQTGLSEGRDSDIVANLANVRVYPEAHAFQDPVSPHLAAKREKKRIDLKMIHLPQQEKLIVEGAGGIFVPINENEMMIDVMSHFNLPILLVTSTRLGTINHTLLTLAAIRARGLSLLGVIMIGEDSPETIDSVEYYGKTTVLQTFPWLPEINSSILKQTVPSNLLMQQLRQTL